MAATHSGLLRWLAPCRSAPRRCPYALASTSRASTPPRTPITGNRQNLPSRRGLCHASAGQSAKAAVDVLSPTPGACCYAGVVFDMDGTLTVSNIDFLDMRTRTGIPSGDLFTVMESWDDGDRIKKSMDVILELEAKAAKALEIQPGLLEVLAYLRDSQVKVGLVTRNTVPSVDAFFRVVGEEWRTLFSPVMTREFKYVKPDKRTLAHFAEAWGLPPYQLLMVGDSTEDVETGNAAGTATCLIAGGGNELPTAAPASATAAAPAAPAAPAGAVPTFVVHSLGELLERLQAGDTALGWGGRAGGSVAGSVDEEGYSSSGSDWESPGAPPPGLGFLDFLFLSGAVEGASCSFPRVDGARFGVPPDDHPGDLVLHVGCGDAALTKLLASSGLQVVAMDADVRAAQRRGLKAVPLPAPLSHASLVDALGTAAAAPSFDAVVFFGALDEEQVEVGGMQAGWEKEEVLEALSKLRKPGGRLCVEAWVADTQQLRGSLAGTGLEVVRWEALGESPSGRHRIRFMAA